MIGSRMKSFAKDYGVLPTLIKPCYAILAVSMNWPPFQGKTPSKLFDYFWTKCTFLC